MGMGGDLGCYEGDAFLTQSLADGVGAAGGCALVEDGASAEVRDGEGGGTIAAVGGAEEGEEGLVCSDAEDLALAQHPAGWGEVEAEGADFADVSLGHSVPLE